MRADDLLHGQAEIALDVLDGCSKQCTTSAVMPCHKPLHNSMQCSDLLVMLHDLLSKQSLCVADLPYGLCHVVIWPAFSHLAQPFYCAVADSMLTVAIYEMTGILPTDPGYGYYRDHVQMFDPGWKGYQTKGPEDWNFDVFDKGNDPEGVLQRCVQLSHSQHDWPVTLG
jgi:hypothetical protein